uniref:Chemokine interleukin-8-like domain-containing protein n=1 Tax=Poecilia reticulata TaxID=8081 RepID=A0A3P9N635_POERE
THMAFPPLIMATEQMSPSFIGRCRCIKTIPAVRSSLIADIKVNEPILAETNFVRKDNKEFCLNPDFGPNVKRLLKKYIYIYI